MDTSIKIQASGPLLEQRNWAEVFDLDIQRELVELGSIAQRMVVADTPRGASGLLRGSTAIAMRGEPGRRSVSVFQSAFYAPIVERGRRPGKRPPTDALVLWVVRKLGITDAKRARGVAFLIARKIGRVGTSGSAAFFKTLQRLEPIAAQRWQQLAERLRQRMGGS
jgi:hypothetical protein